MRDSIKFTDSLRDVIVKMCEGNPGALSVLMELAKRGTDGFITMLDLDDMNLRGPAIWVAYKDFCAHDIDKLTAACRSRDPEMVKAVNQELPDRRCVVGGASHQPQASFDAALTQDAS